jgi:hypothetical protein
MPVTVESQHDRSGPRTRGLAVAAWAMLGVLLAVAFWLLLNACGLRLLQGSPLLQFCPAPVAARGADPALAAELARQRALEAEIERLELALLRAPGCPPAPPARAEVEPAPTPLPAPAPGPAQAPAPEAIPEDAWRERDISFLEGCWELDTDYQVQHVETGEISRAASWQVCFDAAGEGRQTLVFDDGTRCSGPMLGSFAEQGSLQLQDEADLRCDNDTYIYQRRLACERLDPATAQCDSFQPETGGRDEVTFRHRAEQE